MIVRLMHWIVVWFGAWSLNHGMDAGQLLTAITKSYPHWDQQRRLELLGEMTDRAHSRKVLR
jgi:hypothetical protein